MQTYLLSVSKCVPVVGIVFQHMSTYFSCELETILDNAKINNHSKFLWLSWERVWIVISTMALWIKVPQGALVLFPGRDMWYIISSNLHVRGKKFCAAPRLYGWKAKMCILHQPQKFSGGATWAKRKLHSKAHFQAYFICRHICYKLFKFYLMSNKIILSKNNT